MSSNFLCPFCNQYYSNLRGLVKHMNQCVEAFTNTESEIASDIRLDSNEFRSVELQSIREEDLPNMTEDHMQESDEEYTSLISQSNSPNEQFKQFEEEFSHHEKVTFEEVFSQDAISPEEEQEEIESLQSIEESEENVKDFPNEAYADLMNLVVKYNVNNNTADAFIKFFNNHSNLSRSPLPKNIKAGRKYMDGMNMPHLSHKKHSIFVDNEEYLIYYRPILKCIKNLLSNSEIVQHFVYYHQDLRVI